MQCMWIQTQLMHKKIFIKKKTNPLGEKIIFCTSIDREESKKIPGNSDRTLIRLGKTF